MNALAGGRDVVVAGASAGGVDALARMLAPLPPSYSGTVLVVLHVSGTSVLPQILDRSCSLPVAAAKDGAILEPGHVYVAPPDRHLTVEDGHMRLTRGPRENGHRPAVDPLMRSAAAALGNRVVGVILSGTRDDGAAGLLHIKRAGGLTIVQDPGEALYPGMPQNALHSVDVDEILPASAIAAKLVAAARRAVRPPVLMEVPDPPDKPIAETTFSCPDCGGVLEPRAEAGVRWLECRVGHRYNEESLVDAQGTRVEEALWTAVRSLSERAELLRRLAARAEQRGQATTAERARERAASLDGHARTIREVVLSAGLEIPEPAAAVAERER